MVTKLQTVHVRVNDAATGKPTPCRIRFTDGQGNYHAPFGRLAEFATGRNQDVGGNLLLDMTPYAYIDGACEIALPPGPIQVHIHKGPEYVSQHHDMTLAPGKMALRFVLVRWINHRQEGWYGGDTRAHFLSPHAALLEAAAEDLAVVNLLVTPFPIKDSDPGTFTTLANILAFSGQNPALETPGHLVAVNTLNSHPKLGSLGLLNCHRIVFPLSLGGPNGSVNWSLADWCDQCHRKNGLVVWARAGNERRDFDYGEPLADLILGKVDAFEIDFFEDSPFDVLQHWYDLLNAGLPIPLVGASGKDSNDIVLGSMRTYARLQPGEEFSYLSWIEAVRAGRTFVTNSPLLSFQVNGQDPGATIDLPCAGPVHVRAECRSQVPFQHLEILVNGHVARTAQGTGMPTTATLEVDVPLTASSWLAARCRGGQHLAQRPANQCVFAHTSPIQVRVAGQAYKGEPAVIQKLAGYIETMSTWVQHKARCDKESQREHLAHLFQRAREILLQRLAT